MCLKLFKRKKQMAVGIIVTKIEPPMVLRHPQEMPDYTQTIDNINLDVVFHKWMNDWGIPWENYNYWRSVIVINVTLAIPYPAQTWEQDGVRHLDVRPEWCSAGVLSHEQGHNAYALLTDSQKTDFDILFDSIKHTDPKLVYLWTINSYGLSSNVEGHAETLRYWGQEMPPELRQFYPKIYAI